MPRVQLALPADLAGLEVDVVDHPAVLGRRLGLAVLVAGIVQALDRAAAPVPALIADGEEDVIAPDDGRAPAHARGSAVFQHDVLGLAPGVGQRRIVGGDARVRTAKPGPVIGRSRDVQRQQRHHGGGKTRDRPTKLPVEIRRRLRVIHKVVIRLCGRLSPNMGEYRNIRIRYTLPV